MLVVIKGERITAVIGGNPQPPSAAKVTDWSSYYGLPGSAQLCNRGASVQGGVKVAMGSDAVYTMFGQNTRELTWLVKLSMTPEKALQTAMVDAADLLGQSQILVGPLAGHFADLVAVEGDPMQDITVVAIDSIHGVVKGGQVVLQKQ